MSFRQLCIGKYGYQAPVTGPFFIKDLISKASFSFKTLLPLPAYCQVNFIQQLASLSLAHHYELWTVDVRQWSITLSAVNRWIILSWMESISAVLASQSFQHYKRFKVTVT